MTKSTKVTLVIERFPERPTWGDLYFVLEFSLGRISFLSLVILSLHIPCLVSCKSVNMIVAIHLSEVSNFIP